MRLEGKVAIVSGGGTGIGAATARLFAREGAKVVVTGRRPEPIGAVADEIGGRAVPGDATDARHATEAVSVARDAFGGPDIVVANAGLGFGGAAGDVDDERWERTLGVNVTGAFRLVRAALPVLLGRGGGSIVLVSSVSGLVSGPEGAAYQTSKAAMLGLARSVAVDYGPKGIRANTVCPGWSSPPWAIARWTRSPPTAASRARRPTGSPRGTSRSAAPRETRRSQPAACSSRATSRPS
jgi:meso-butanediol dehydrogenase/(S,S)-butanediol dehydrogenase/diacetyl reductase